MRRDQLARVTERFERYGDLYHLSFFGRDRYVTRHPEHLREVLIERANDFEKPTEGPAARQLRRFLGQGLLTSNGELWRKQRRLIQPAFRKERLQVYAEVVVAHTERALVGWRNGSMLDVSREMTELTLGIVCKTLFDHELPAETDRVAEAMRQFRASFSDIGAILPSFLPLPGNARLSRALADVDSVIYGLMDAPRSPERVDLLATLSLQGERGVDEPPMGRKQLRDELLTLFLAGHETTAHALTWTWHLLALHPEVEAKVQAEVDHVIGTRTPAWSDLEGLVYTEQVLSESLRLFPPAYALLRTCSRDSQIGPYAVLRGTDVVLWVYHAQRDPRWFEQPDRFDPDRFEPKRRRAMVQGAYLPFGAGSRTCIGKQLAVTEALLIMACVARRFSLREVGGARVSPEAALTLAPRGVRMRVEERLANSP